LEKDRMRDAARSTLEAVYSIISEAEGIGRVNARLNHISWDIDCSGHNLLAVLMAACGDLSSLFRLLWEGHRRVGPGKLIQEPHHFVQRLPCRVVGLLRERVGCVFCPVSFQVVSACGEAWVGKRSNSDMDEVLFKVEGVGLRPLVRRTGRGFRAIPGQGLLGPLTPLVVRNVGRLGGRVVVRAFGAMGGGPLVVDPGAGCCGRHRASYEAAGRYEEGMSLLGSGNLVEAERGLRECAGVGHVHAMWTLGDLHRGSIDNDLVAAFSWYRKAAEGGHSGAMYVLGLALCEGEGVPADRKGG
jgi:hypothetical protein